MKIATKNFPEALSDSAIGSVREPKQPAVPNPPPKINARQLVDKLNHTNFQNGTILAYFTHDTYDQTLVRHAKPMPCLDTRVNCIWADAPQSLQELESYRFKHFLLNEDQETFVVEAKIFEINEDGVSFLLPEISTAMNSREVERHACENVTVQLIQNGALFGGSLADFSAVAFRISLRATPPQRFQWINPDLPVDIIVARDTETLYTGECRIIRQSYNHDSGTFVLQPVNQEISRFKAKKKRSDRHEIVPVPNMVFRHPLTRQMLSLPVIDLSGSGFSVREDRGRATLLAGMIIPEVELQLAGGFKAKCKVQVIYRSGRPNEPQHGEFKCGLAFLDMDVQAHVRLVGFLHQVKNSRSYINNTVDMDELWNFFFRAGFIYPEKYAYMEQNRDEIQKTYKKLYTENPSIARHFVYQNSSEILGHMQMIRYYEDAWLIQHHAATHTVSNRAGLAVLDQIGEFANDSHSLYSMHMDYLMCYFRLDKRFPSRIFGGAARSIKDPQVCSVDPFAYFHHSRSTDGEKPLANTWTMVKTTPEDLTALKSFYGTESGGLMIPSHDLDPGMGQTGNVADEYQRIGLKKQKHLFSLKKHNRLKAIFLVNISDVGLNLSDLTNSITAIILDQDRFPPDILYSACSQIMAALDQESMPVLLFPVEYADNRIPYEKIYNLWILNTQHSDQYFDFKDRLMRFIRE